MPTLTPNAAAKQTGLSRRSIMRAIEAHELTARRDNRNCWQIEAEDLAQWARSEQAQPVAQAAQARPDEALSAQIGMLREMLDEMRTDRDRWHALATRPWWKRLVA